MQVHELEVGRQRLLLRLPVLLCHRVTESSPLRAWRGGPSALAADANSEIVVVVCHPANPALQLVTCSHTANDAGMTLLADNESLGASLMYLLYPQERWLP